LQEAGEATFKQFDVTDPAPEDVEQMTIGATPETVSDVCEEYGIDPDEFCARATERPPRRSTEVRAGRKTLYDDLDTLDDLDVSMGIVSSNQQATVDFVLDHFDVRDMFGTAYGRAPGTVESLRHREAELPLHRPRARGTPDADSALFVGTTSPTCAPRENAGIDSAFIRRPTGSPGT